MDLTAGIGKLLSSSTSVFRAFAEHYDMVYFGRIHQDDEHHIVKGVTVSNEHVDDHYAVGTVHGYDTILLTRTDAISGPHTEKREKYTWTIMQLDLHTKYDFPHVFIDGGHHDELFYQTLFIKFARLMKVDKAAFSETNASFNDRFTAYTPPDSLDDLPVIINGEIGDTLVHHFSHFDFEWYQDRLLIYSTGRPATKHLLEHMLRAGLWLARELDVIGQQKTPAPSGADALEQV